MGKRTHQFKVDNLCRLLLYMLGRKPDEFGLVPDRDGFVTYKELLQAINEEPEWHYVRRSHINEVLMGKDRSLFQAEEKCIRVMERQWLLDVDHPQSNLNKVLFTSVRRKSHPVVMERGVKAAEGKHLVLTQDKGMALRLGRRHDNKPVILEILASEAENRGVLFYAFGSLFLCQAIPANVISGPPVSKEPVEKRRVVEEKTREDGPIPDYFMPGSFSLDISRDPDPYRRSRAKKRKGWKEEVRKMRRDRRR